MRYMLGAFARRFLPTPSARRATVISFVGVALGVQFLPTPSARRATGRQPSPGPITPISTHALREEGDWMLQASWP